MQEPPADAAVWLGIDIGTQSVRALAATTGGRVVGRGSVPLTGRRESGRHEQDPASWWPAVSAATRAALTGTVPHAVRGVSVCSTSGTILLVAPSGEPLTQGLMYDDGRAHSEAAEVQRAGAEVWARLGTAYSRRGRSPNCSGWPGASRPGPPPRGSPIRPTSSRRGSPAPPCPPTPAMP